MLKYSSSNWEKKEVLYLQTSSNIITQIFNPPITPDEWRYSHNIFFYFYKKTYVAGTYQKHLPITTYVFVEK